MTTIDESPDLAGHPLAKRVQAILADARSEIVEMALEAILQMYTCRDDEDGTLIETVKDFYACDVMKVRCYNSTFTHAHRGWFLFISDNGASPAEDFADWSTKHRDFDHFMSQLTDAIDQPL